MILNFTNYLSKASLYEAYLMEAEKKAKISEAEDSSKEKKKKKKNKE